MESEAFTDFMRLEQVQRNLNTLRNGLEPNKIILDGVDLLLVHNRDVDGTLDCLHQFFGECSSLYPQCHIALEIISSDTNRPIPFPAPLIASLLNQIPHQLKSLRLWNVTPSGDIDHLSTALGQQEHLEKFNCQGCHLNETDPVRLASALAVLPRMKQITLETWDSAIPQDTSLQMALQLAQSRHLEELKLLGLTSGSMVPLFGAVEAAAGLQGLDLLGGGIPLSLSCMPSLTSLLQNNTSLRSFKVSIDPRLSLQPFAAGLQNNSTLKELKIDILRNWGLDRDDLDLFLTLLEQHNFTLEELNVTVPVYLDTKVKEKGDRIKFLLQLNKDHHRHLMMQTENLDLFLETLELQDDLSVITYYLAKRTDLWIPSNS